MGNKFIVYLVAFFIFSLGLNAFAQPGVGSSQVIGGSSKSSVNVDAPRDDIFEHIHTDYKKPIPYSPLREADVIYSKRVWQIIDFKKKINQAFYYPIKDHTNWKNLVNTLYDAVKAGELTAYDTYDDEFTTPMPISKVAELLQGEKEVIQLSDEDGNYTGKDTTVTKNSFVAAEVTKLRIKEVWYFDKQRSQMQVRILGICPVWEYYDSKTQRQIPIDMFWIYFPEARHILAKAEVFNRKNGAQRRTYDDIFWKRMFSSYIYKEENVYDRMINEYAIGMDALIESERIKNELFELEGYMWEF